MNPFGELVKIELKRRKKSIAWLAVSCDVSPTTIWNTMHYARPKYEYVIFIISVLGLDQDECLGLAGLK